MNKKKEEENTKDPKRRTPKEFFEELKSGYSNFTNIIDLFDRVIEVNKKQE